MGDLDHADILYLRRNHPAWRLLAAETAPLVIGFLHRAFIAPNARAIPETELETQLDDYLYALRDRADEDPYPRPRSGSPTRRRPPSPSCRPETRRPAPCGWSRSASVWGGRKSGSGGITRLHCHELSEVFLRESYPAAKD